MGAVWARKMGETIRVFQVGGHKNTFILPFFPYSISQIVQTTDLLKIYQIRYQNWGDKTCYGDGVGVWGGLGYGWGSGKSGIWIKAFLYIKFF